MRCRDFLLALAAGTASCLSACSTARTAVHSTSPASSPTQSSPLASTSSSPTPSPTPSLSPLHLQDGPSPLPTPTPADSLITGLLGNVGDVVTITINDGVDSSVVDAYLNLAKDSGIRLTFFVTGCYPSRTGNRDRTRPLVKSGQIQLANHTWTRPGLTTLSEDRIIDEPTRCEDLLRNTYGVTGAPFVRPPYDGRSSYTDSVCAKIGYTTTATRYSSLRDSGQLTPEVLLGEAQKWLPTQHIVIGHANFLTVTFVYGQVIDILCRCSLQTAALDDVYFDPGHNRHA